MSLHAGFDFSWNEASFAAATSDGEVLFERRLPLSGRDASALPSWMLAALKEKGLDFTSPDSWTVGSGPGSFTGMRIAAALVTGICFGREKVRKRSMPTACALAFSLAKTKPFSKAVALFDGRKGDILAFPMLRGADGFVKAEGHGRVLSHPEEAAFEDGCALLALAKDKTAIERFFGAAVASRVDFAERVEAASLALNDPDDFKSPLSELVYIRPAVFVEPKTPRAL